MKVLHTLDSLNRGGAETLALDVCRNAGRFGIDVTFVASGSGDLEKDFKDSGVKYIHTQREFPLDPNLIWKFRKIIKEHEIQIVQGYQPVEILHLYLAAIGINNVKIVQNHQGYIEGRKNVLAAKFISPKIDANIACSRTLFPWLRKELGLDTSKNFFMIHNGVDEQRLRPSENSIKAELGFDEESFLLGMIANFRPDPTKDQMTVCRALPKVFEEFKDANFIFVGKVSEGGEENFDKCIRFCDENGIGEKVFFLGGRDDVPDILDSLDLFVFSSLQEGLPISVTEAMLAKVPLVVSDIPQLLEVTDNGETAEIFKTKDAEELSEKILKLLKDENLRENLSDKAYQFAKQNFSIEAHLEGLKTLYLNLLDSSLDEAGTNSIENEPEKSESEKNDSIFGLD